LKHPALPPLRPLACLIAALLGTPAWAQAPAATEQAALQELRATTLALIDALVEQGLLSRARADELLQKSRDAARRQAAVPAPAAAPAWGAPPAATAAAKPVVRVPYLPETARTQMKEDIRNEILATARDEGWTDGRVLPAWTRSLKIEGDVRVRAQADLLADDNLAPEVFRAQSDSPAWAPDLTNTRVDRGRMTLRARLGASVKASDSVTAGVRVATGSTTSGASSESVTMGNSAQRIAIGLDRAWLRWEPQQGNSLEGGRMAVPFERTDLLFPEDLSLDGVAARGELDLSTGLYGFATAGYFALEEFANGPRDKALLGAQLGLDWAPDGDWNLRGALGYYHFRNVEGVRESELPPSGALAGTTAYQSSAYPAGLRLKGNTLINLNAPASTASPVWGLASRFRPVNLTVGVVSHHLRPIDLGLSLDLVRNTGFEIADIVRRAGTNSVSDLRARTNGVQARFMVGHPHLDEAGQWQGALAWRRFGRDAWIDGLTDTSWHGGGTNYQGFSLGAQYAFDRRATLGARFISTRNLDDGVRYTDSAGNVSGNLSSAPLRIETVQLEATLKF
jgi:hypothetical protein